MMQSDSQKKSRIILFGTFAVMIPIVILAIVFFAAKNDAENKREYDQIRLEQAQRIAEREAQKAAESVSNVVAH